MTESCLSSVDICRFRVIVEGVAYGLGIRDIGSVARFPKENRLEEEPNVIVSPVSAKDISEVSLAQHMVVCCESRGYRLPHFMER
jgi:hypothetical protein